jgi:hypothetical protein
MPLNILPGESVEVRYEFEWEGHDRIEIELSNKGKFWFHQIGVEPIILRRQFEKTVTEAPAR